VVVPYVKIRPVKRGPRTGVATYAAAYRSGESIVDERTGNLYKYAWRKDVSHKEIVLPTRFSSNAELNWARDRSTLWNTAEHSERQKNSRVAREYIVALPSEFTHAQRLDLTRSFSQALADRYQNAVDFAIHEPRLGRAENYHAHLLTTTREITPTGLGRKTGIERTEKWWRIEPYRQVAELWRDFFNKALRDAGKEALPYPPNSNKYYTAETGHLTWAEYKKKVREQGVDVNQLAREDWRSTRLTPAERELVNQRKEAIRLRKEAGLEQRKAGQIEHQRVRRAARTPEQIKADNQARRRRFRALPETRKEEIKQREREWQREWRKGWSPEQVKKEAQRQHDYQIRNADKLKQQARARYSKNAEKRKAPQVQTAGLEQPARKPSINEIQEQAVKGWLEDIKNQKQLEQQPVTTREKGRTRGRDEGLER